MSGTVLAGRYQLDRVRPDAAGSATGAVQFDATDLSSQEGVSVRLVPVAQLVDPALGSTTTSDAVAAFEDQMDTAAGLRHPCIETVLDHGEVTLDGERYVYSVAERLAGGSLREFLDRGRRLTPSQALIVGIDVCRALDSASKLGIVHGDLRPSRLVFGLDRRVRVVGFGAPVRPVDSLSLDQVNYSAPEVLEGGARSGSSDVYSLALVLIEAMTGDVPFAGDSAATAGANRRGKLLPVNADFGALAQVIERAGRPTGPERFTAREFGQALVQAAEKMPRPTPIEVVGTGLFDEEVAASDPSAPVAAPVDPSQPAPVPGAQDREPILIRTTPRIPDRETPTGPMSRSAADATNPTGIAAPASGGLTIVGRGTATGGTPLTIGGDDTGPMTLDADTLRALAADDPTAVAERPKKKRWGRRIAVVVVVLVVLAGGGVGAWFTVLNPKNPVPALAGLTEAEARNQVAKFGWGLDIASERSDEVEAGKVIRTDPVFGANLAKRDSITLVVSAGPTLSPLPELAGLAVDAARAKLTELGLQATTADVNDEIVAPGVVVSWTIPDQPTLKVGEEVVKGTTVQVNVSIGPAARDVPDLTGKTLEEATAQLTQMGLLIVEGEPAGHPEIAAGKISGQTPAIGEKLPRGGTVTVVISKGQITTLIPTIYNRDFKTVKERLEKYGMVIGKVTGNKARGLIKATIDGKQVRNLERVVVGKTVDLTFP